MPKIYDYVGLTELAQRMGRSRQHTLRMVNNGILSDCGYHVRPIHAKRDRGRIARYMVGIPRNYKASCNCPDCGHQWEQENTIPTECPSCKSTTIETRKAA